MYSAYIIRFEKPNGRHWVNIVGQDPRARDYPSADQSRIADGVVGRTERARAQHAALFLEQARYAMDAGGATSTKKASM